MRQTSSLDPRVSIINFSEPVTFSQVDDVIRNSIESNFLYLVIDCSNISRLDYPALGELIGLRSQLKKKGGDVILFNLAPDIEQQFNLVGIQNVIRTAENEHDAIKKFQWFLNLESETVLLQFPGTMDYVPGIRFMISHVATIRGFSKKDAYRIETIVDELCNNAIEHGVEKDSHFSIKIRCRIDKEKFCLTIVNPGDPGQYDDAYLNRLREAVKSASQPGNVRGRGLPIVSMLADKLDFFIEDGGVAVYIEKMKKND